MVAAGVTFVMAVLAKSTLSLCVGDVGDCGADSCDDVMPIFLTIFCSSFIYVLN